MKTLTISVFLVVATMAVGCNEPTTPEPSAGTGGSGGAPVTGGRGGSAGAGGSGGAGGASNAPVVGSDAAAEAPRDGSAEVRPGGDGAPSPVVGDDPFVPGGGCAAGCMALAGQYAEGVAKAKSCTPGVAGACSKRARGSVACGGCPAWVNDTTEIAPLADRFRRECGGCFLGGSGPNRCHLVGCAEIDTPVCMPLPAGGGTCVNQERDRSCAAGVKTGSPCMFGQDVYCMGGSQSFCLCLQGGWQCS